MVGLRLNCQTPKPSNPVPFQVYEIIFAFVNLLEPRFSQIEQTFQVLQFDGSLIHFHGLDVVIINLLVSLLDWRLFNGNVHNTAAFAIILKVRVGF